MVALLASVGHLDSCSTERAHEAAAYRGSAHKVLLTEAPEQLPNRFKAREDSSPGLHFSFTGELIAMLGKEPGGDLVPLQRAAWKRQPEIGSRLTTHYPLPTTHYSLFTPHYSLLTTHYPLLTTHYSLLTTHFPLLTKHSSLLTTHYSLYSLLTTHYPLPTTHYSLLTTHYSLFTSHYSLDLPIHLLPGSATSPAGRRWSRERSPRALAACRAALRTYVVSSQ